MRILGIDPGFGILGWSIIEDNLKIVDFGSIETPKNMLIDERLFVIYTEICSIIKTHKPDMAAIEKLFFSKNTTTALQVSQAIGVILLALRQHALVYSEYPPVTVKKAITGHGKADKKQLQFMIQKIYNLSEIPQPDDAADAIAIATCHAMTTQ
jgi:crossover junction endodeoxyribonuclease RuvC